MFKREDRVHPVGAAQALNAEKRLPRNCSAVLRFGCASIMCVNLLDIDARIFRCGPEAAAPSTGVPPV